MSADNIKPDRTPEDLLFQVMLDLGVLLSSKIDEEEIAGKKVFSVENGYLIACFDNDITEKTVMEIAKRHPFYAIFRDSGLASDSVAVNFEQIFETYSPKTKRKVPIMVPERANWPKKIGRNELCPCGSGKKYKRCHGR